MNDTKPGVPAGTTCAVSVTFCPNADNEGEMLFKVVWVETCALVNVTVQEWADDIVTMASTQSGSPLHPTMNDPAAGVAVSATTCPNPNTALQVTPQLMPAGLLDTVTLPEPVLLTVSGLGGIEVNVAVQL
jgi:hypothetical protein